MTPAIVEVALNGGRSREEHPDVPLVPAEVVADAAACFAAGATMAHLHARGSAGGWSADAGWYAEAIEGVRAAAPGMVVGVTSIRPDGEPVSRVVAMLDALAADPATQPDVVSVNLGHIAIWEPAGEGRRTVHYPNAYDDVVAVLRACRRHDMTPELGVMDLGFVGNAVALAEGGELPAHPWFLVELDSPGFGAGAQVAPATVESYAAVAAALGACFPVARWAAHGNGRGTFAVIEAALAVGQHARVGMEDTVVGPDGAPMGNVEQVRWAVAATARAGRRVATAGETRSIAGPGRSWFFGSGGTPGSL